MDFLLQFVPSDLTPIEAGGLILFSYITSAVSATFGLGGGVMMLIAMASIMPALAVIPVHGAVQVGSNGGRAWMLRQHINWSIFRYFLIGSIIGAAVASQIVVSLPSDVLRLILGLFVLYIVWGPKPTKWEIGDVSYIPVGIGTTFASMFVGATGLLIGAFMPPGKLGRMTTVTMQAICAMIQHALKIVVFGLLGFAFWEWLPLVLAMIA
ncbi:MAG: sulfite exporter TauE/SafE family protein, partial [Alphaproteobacteria bacterium]|nr:sulfite exporter TauE/SafE family protein [Alphaproteobacteria bacterium]